MKGIGKSSARSANRGFTLLEVMVVCAIAGLVTAIALPRLGADGDRDVTLAARRLADAFSLARDRAVLRGRTEAIELDLDRQRWRANGEEIALPAGVRFAAAQRGDGARVVRGRLLMGLRPAGDALPAVVDLLDARGHGARVVLPPARARATVLRSDRS